MAVKMMCLCVVVMMTMTSRTTVMMYTFYNVESVYTAVNTLMLVWCLELLGDRGLARNIMATMELENLLKLHEEMQKITLQQWSDALKRILHESNSTKVRIICASVLCNNISFFSFFVCEMFNNDYNSCTKVQGTTRMYYYKELLQATRYCSNEGTAALHLLIFIIFHYHCIQNLVT